MNATTIVYRHPGEKDMLAHYAAVLGPEEVRDIVARGGVATAREARALARFYWVMVDAAVRDVEAGRVPRGELTSTSEHLLSTLRSHFRQGGFERAWENGEEEARALDRPIPDEPPSHWKLPWLMFREWIADTPLPRVPEPDLVMVDDAANSYAETGRQASVLSGIYVMNTGIISGAIQGCRRVVDLACGPANQLVQVASLHPEISFTGVDLSDTMLAQAERRVADLGLKNVRFEKRDVTRLTGFTDGAYDGVISTMALHHLPTVDALRGCFHEIHRILAPNGGVCLIDFSRMRTIPAVEFVATLNVGRASSYFIRDTRNSQWAAFLPADFEQLGRHTSRDIRVHVLWPLPNMLVAHTPLRPLTPANRARLQEMRRQVDPLFRKDLDICRWMFRWGGLERDPLGGFW